MGSNIAVSAPDGDAGRRAAARARLPRRRRLLPLRDGERSPTSSCRRRSGPRRTGTMTNLEGRVILPAPCDRRRPPACGPISRSCAPSPPRSASGDSFRYGGRSRGVRRAVPRERRRRPADYSGITYERIDAEDGVFWPCPGADHPGTPRLFAESFPTPSGRARFHRVAPRQNPVDDRDADHPLYPHDRPRARALPVGHADAAVAGAASRWPPSRSPKCIRRPRGGSAWPTASASRSRPGAAPGRSR